MRMRLRTNVTERLNGCGKWFIQTDDDARNVKEVLSEKQLIDFTEMFGRKAPLYLEIGCGQGGFICASALLHPENDYFAVERIGNVILTGAERASKEKIENLRFMRVKAECLEKYIPCGSVDGIFLNFSTPLPRKGYEKQRLTSPRFLEIYAKLLKKDGFVSQKTDSREFFEFSSAKFEENGFRIVFKTENLHENGETGIVTEYERRFIELGKPIYALRAQKT